MDSRYLLCTDLDRTLLPNGGAPESPEARRLFARLAARPEVALAYVTGRHRALVEEAMDDYGIPVPDYVIGDVGTSIYSVADGTWTAWESWQRDIAPDWGGLGHGALAALFADITALHLQEPEKQGPFKVSWYAPADTRVDDLLPAMERLLKDRGVRAALIWSLDETTGTGLLDLLPARATKLHGVEFLMRHAGFSPERTVFSGDSGNDLPVLASPIQSVLVANATDEVRRQAESLARDAGAADALYCARGGFLDLNGNYAAGILEGFVHYIPQARRWLCD